ncbi:MAG TPA: 30S ribosomal protein S12 methylthiotransferase RimO [Acholeplasmataceae bacterium]|nr:30S ribosomal protein S12 methylthiotransferase RimO [Acholeplasmataceae bacterium]
MKLGMISLGCSKNLVDSEMFLGLAQKYNITIVNNIAEADILVVNTCGFIESAKKEALDTIFELIDYKKDGKIVIAMGCLVERYFDNLKSEIPEVDYFIPIKDYHRLGEIFEQITQTSSSKDFYLNPLDRVLTTQPHSAYIKIAEGCNNRCSYCAIPLIRGPFRSRDLTSIIEEAKGLAKQGVKEVTLIAQDTTRYGTDLTPKSSLKDLLEQLSEIEGLEIIRFLYLYPDEITKELIHTIKNNNKIAPYFDIPLQHASDKILKAMNRRGTKSEAIELIDYIRKEIPDAIIRTTMITGFPGETDEDFEILHSFIKEVLFDRLGVFSYSEEEDTPAYNFNYKIDQKIKDKRARIIASTQKEISLALHQKLVGKSFKVIIDSFDPIRKQYRARSYAFAPDNVDGYIYVDDDQNIIVGNIYQVKITKAHPYDLEGIIEK